MAVREHMMLDFGYYGMWFTDSNSNIVVLLVARTALAKTLRLKILIGCCAYPLVTTFRYGANRTKGQLYDYIQ